MTTILRSYKKPLLKFKSKDFNFKFISITKDSKYLVIFSTTNYFYSNLIREEYKIKPIKETLFKDITLLIYKRPKDIKKVLKKYIPKVFNNIIKILIYKGYTTINKLANIDIYKTLIAKVGLIPFNPKYIKGIRIKVLSKEKRKTTKRKIVKAILVPLISFKVYTLLRGFIILIKLKLYSTFKVIKGPNLVLIVDPYNNTKVFYLLIKYLGLNKVYISNFILVGES
ncbi:hypothetical protein LZ32DRAFT_614197 [Colletotrichum eremochloae]|nr:hypothetical protein LZ32DRAFT_614197 [Colletotrichum eremochloae]